MLKRTLSLLLALISIVGLIPVQAFAQGAEDAMVASIETKQTAEDPAAVDKEERAFVPTSDIDLSQVRNSTKATGEFLFGYDDCSWEYTAAIPADWGDTWKYEDDYSNDSMASAQFIDVNSSTDYTVVGGIGDLDVDIYKFTLTRQSYLEIYSLDASTSNSLVFAIYNSNGDHMKTCTGYGANSSGYYVNAIEYNALAKGTYYVAFLDMYGDYGYSYNFRINAAPITPKITSATNTQNGIKIVWNKAPGAQRYTIWRANYGSNTVKKLGTSVTTSFVDKTATSGTNYTYYVVSNDTNSSESSNYVKAKSKNCTRLTAPSFTLANVDKGVKLTWKKVPGATGYQIWRKVGSNAWKQVKNITSGGTLQWTDPNTTKGKTYQYRVKAVYKNTEIYSSAVVSGYYTKKIVRLVSKGIDSVIAIGNGQCVVNLNHNEQATGYQVRVKLNGNVIKTVKFKGNTNLQVKITGMKAGKTYAVQVRAYKTLDGNTYYSRWSNAKKVTAY